MKSQSLDLAVTDASAKDERAVGRFRCSYLARVPEVLEHLTDRSQQDLRLLAALVGRVDDRAAEDDVVGEEGDQAVYVAGLDRTAEFLHVALHFRSMSRISGGYTIRCRNGLIAAM